MNLRYGLNGEYIFEGGFGLERETLRVTADGRLAQTPHPFADKRFERDFCENQLEIITPVCESVHRAVEELGRLSECAERRLAESGEYLWLCSNPPHIESEDEIPVARFADERSYKTEYRKKLASRYGKRLMLYSGIHFNFSFSDKFLKAVYDSIGGGEDFRGFKDRQYLRLFKYASRYSWLIVLLTASSPIYDGSLDGDGISGATFDGYSSRRNGDKGYWNSFVPVLDYSGIESYTASVRRYIESGELFSAGELYLPVRVKSSGENSLESLEEKGIDHIELRMFDINPLEPYGISESDLRFVHYFLLYLFSLPDFEFTADLQRMAIENHKAAARFELDCIRIGGYSAAEAAHGLLDDMEIFFEGFPKVLEEISRQRAKLSGGNRACETVYGEYSEYSENFHEMFLEKIKEGRGVRVCANCSERA